MNVIIIRAKEMDSKSIEEQFLFYKQQFEEGSCVMSGSELRNDWVIYNDQAYSTEAFEIVIAKEKAELNERIESLNKQIKRAVSELDKLESEI
ncbi:hypothetical protein DFQ00_102333 [Paenibacillus barcinonensis]|uniref:Uncharacterized protein n=2 Tax=Paenibacillus barcinonensis TaxID=198119 RepID=A0A2V4WT53_PAEBA|nr:hypothetical protein [Paenibacillus barcinonensis]PYE51539.1 hypothetical protein DFQ00_102333 [Paenibacillus barcinonensis]